MAKKKNEGKQFEDDFKKSVPMYAFIYRFKDGTASWSDNVCPKCKTQLVSNTRFQAQNICDFMVFNNPHLYFLELKSTKSKSLPFSAVRENQKKELTEAGRRKNISAGLVVNFRELDETYYMSIELFNECMEKLTSKSIPVKTFREYAILIDQEQKQVHWRYNIDGFFKKKETEVSNLF